MPKQASSTSNATNRQSASNTNDIQTSVDKSKYQTIKEGWGNWPNFMASYGLKTWDQDDVDEGNAILEHMMEEDRRASNEAKAAGSNNGGKQR
jgi:hypothetical protein